MAFSSAAARGHIEVVRLLLEKGTDPDCTGYGCRTRLLCAAACGRLEVVKLLLHKKANPNSGHYDLGRTPLSRATEGRHVEVVRLLLEKCANLDPPRYGSRDRAALSYAAEGGHLKSGTVACWR